MATSLSNLKLLSSISHTNSRLPLLHSFSPPTHPLNSSKPFQAPTISSRRRIECGGISFASRMRTQTASTKASIVSEDKEEDWDDNEEEDAVEEDGEEFVPLREMTRWLQNKPAGFGVGMRYDTAAEDKLLEEMKQNQKDRVERNSKPRASEMVTEVKKTDPEVRVWNLPKKKNIDRDLWKAFKGFPGIISINPAVTGNRKTKDPICRGFSFIGFESYDAAYRFVQKYSKQNLVFGKVQKQISCDVISVNGVLNSPESSKSTNSRLSGDEISISNAIDISESINGMEPNKKEFSVFPSDRNISLSSDENEVNEVLQFNTPMLNKKKTAKRVKTKPLKSSKGHILGSSAKLKIKDRAVLTGVFSKYGKVSSAALKEI